MKKPSKSSLTRKLDKLISQIVHQRGKCQRCGSTETLQAAHIFSRQFRNTRWDEKNILLLCAKCHFWSHHEPTEFAEFVKKMLIPKEYAQLLVNKELIWDRTLKDMMELYDELLAHYKTFSGSFFP